MRKHKWFKAIWTLEAKDRDGKFLWKDGGRNHLADEGEYSFLQTYFRGVDVPNLFYLRLCGENLSESSTLATIAGEPSGSGYAPIALTVGITDFPTLEQISGDWSVVSKQVIWTASGGSIGPFNTAYLATTSDNTGKLICYFSLARERTLSDGATFTLSIRITMQ